MLKTFFVFFVVVFFITSCKPSVQKVQLLAKPQCLKSQSRCNIKTSIGTFTLNFNVSKVKVETPFTMQVSYVGKQEIINISGYMEGKNMFMGKIPLLFKSESIKNTFSAETMLVACTEPKMEWRVWINAEVKLQNQLKTMNQGFFVDFASSY